MKSVNSVFSMYGTTIFEVMSVLAREHGAINLGQGFPDFDGPPDMKSVANSHMVDNLNQYPPMMGLVELRQAVADHNRRFYKLDIDWESEVLITSGATEALADCMLALLDPGDEVVVIEPVYDSYLPMIIRAGGVPKTVRLTPPDWALPEDALKAAFSERTKMVLLNSPQNPAGKVYSPTELFALAQLIMEYNAYAVCDEVYEHIVFDGHVHTPLMTLPGMRDRCIRIGSAGKTFSMTGWKVGYVTAPPALLAAIAKAHQFVTFTTPPMLQAAVAVGLGSDGSYFTELSGGLQKKRDFLASGLAEAGLGILTPDGTYFLNADIRPTGFSGDDVAFCQKMTQDAGVTMLPVSAFYIESEHPDQLPKHFVRFCFAKNDDVLEAACDKLQSYFKAC
ncbi:MAG: aminotransferase [Rhodospirillales bacterium]|nr:aminotransferase [Rhodospirillales bacterium]